MHYGWHRSESKHSAALAAVAPETPLILFMPRPARLVTEEALVNPAVMKASSDPGALKFISEVKAQWRGGGGGRDELRWLWRRERFVVSLPPPSGGAGYFRTVFPPRHRSRRR